METLIYAVTGLGLVGAALQVGGIARLFVDRQSRGGLLCLVSGCMLGVAFALILGVIVMGRL